MPASAGRQDGDRELTITRIYDASAHLLFEAWSRPEHLMRWFGPVGWPVTLCEVDFRKGGRWRMAMTGPSGEQNEPFGGVYLEIVPDSKIVFDNAFEGNPAKKMIMTVTFEERAGRTTLTWHTRFMSPAMKDEYVGMGIEAGANSGLDQLADVVSGLT